MKDIFMFKGNMEKGTWVLGIKITTNWAKIKLFELTRVFYGNQIYN